MRPFVFMLQPNGKKTVVQASSLSVWRKTGVPLEGDGFQDAFEEDQTRSFCESIEAGMSVIYLEATEKGQTAGIPYQSCRIEDNVIFYEKREEP